jgi:hypothetical protein
VCGLKYVADCMNESDRVGDGDVNMVSVEGEGLQEIELIQE